MFALSYFAQVNVRSVWPPAILLAVELILGATWGWWTYLMGYPFLSFVYNPWPWLMRVCTYVLYLLPTVTCVNHLAQVWAYPADLASWQAAGCWVLPMIWPGAWFLIGWCFNKKVAEPHS